MANKKPKGSANKSKSNKPKNTAKPAEKPKSEILDEEVVEVEDVEEVEEEDEEIEEVEDRDESEKDEDEEKEAETDSDDDGDEDDDDEKDDNEEEVKTSAKFVATKKTVSSKESSHKEEKLEVVSEKGWLKGFFARKYEGKESILTIFKNRRFYGALLGEVIGTALVTLLLFSLSLMGIHSMATYSFAVLAIFIAVYAFSGACLNPIVTVGMMASRRLSVIRGMMYIIAEVLGAWLGWLIFNSFHLAGGDTAYDIPAMTAVGENQFWIITMVELAGAVIIAFFYARALKYKRSVFTFAATIAGGMALAVVLGYVVSAAFFSLNSNFIFNPATALMFQIFPTAGENFGEILGGICQALSIYAIFPMIGGVVGFYLSDFTARLSGEDD